MKVDIWSDIRCPFCYIGKRKFEAGLAQFENKEQVEIEWHSFELNPTLETTTALSVLDFLAETKNIDKNHIKQIQQQLVDAGAEFGLAFNFDRSIVSNSNKAHQLVQFAITRGLGDAALEVLFKAHFTNGQNIDDTNTLIDLGTLIGIDPSETAQILASCAYSGQVQKGKDEAEAMGISGVPFFIFDNKFAVAGAQTSGTFLRALRNAWNEYEQEHVLIETLTKSGDARLEVG